MAWLAHPPKVRWLAGSRQGRAMACSPKFALGPAPKLRRQERNVRDVPDPTFTGPPQTAAIDPCRSLIFAFGTALPVQGFGYRPVDDLSASGDGRCPKASCAGFRIPAR